MDAFEAHASFGTRHGIQEKIIDIVNGDNSTSVKSLSLALQVKNDFNLSCKSMHPLAIKTLC